MDHDTSGPYGGSPARGKAGLGPAYIAGFKHALELWPDTDYIIQMDADLSHDPSYLPSMLEQAEKAELVIATRYLNGIRIVNWPLSRLIISYLGTAYARLVTGMKLSDYTSGFKCYRVEALKRLHLESIRANGYAFQIETTHRAWRMNMRIMEFPIIFYDRTTGVSKMSLRIALEGLGVVSRLALARFRLRRGAMDKVQDRESSQATEPGQEI